MRGPLCLLAAGLALAGCREAPPTAEPRAPAAQESPQRTAEPSHAAESPAETAPLPGVETGVPSLRQSPPRRVAYTIHQGRYELLDMTIGKADAWLRQNGIEPLGGPTIVYLRDPSNTAHPSEYLTEVRFDVAQPPSGKEVRGTVCSFREIPARTLAVQVERGAPGDVVKRFVALQRWVEAQGLEISGPAERTGTTAPLATPPEEQLHELAFPVEKAPAPAAGEPPDR
jgi:effector-binding domain-containing protein